MGRFRREGGPRHIAPTVEWGRAGRHPRRRCRARPLPSPGPSPFLRIRRDSPPPAAAVAPGGDAVGCNARRNSMLTLAPHTCRTDNIPVKESGAAPATCAATRGLAPDLRALPTGQGSKAASAGGAHRDTVPRRIAANERASLRDLGPTVGPSPPAGPGLPQRRVPRLSRQDTNSRDIDSVPRAVRAHSILKFPDLKRARPSRARHAAPRKPPWRTSAPPLLSVFRPRRPGPSAALDNIRRVSPRHRRRAHPVLALSPTWEQLAHMQSVHAQSHVLSQPDRRRPLQQTQHLSPDLSADSA